MTEGQSFQFDKQQCFFQGEGDRKMGVAFYGVFHSLSIKPFLNSSFISAKFMYR